MPQEKHQSSPAAPRSSHVLSPLSRSLLAILSGHGSSLECRKEGLPAIRRSKPLISLPSPGSCCYQQAASVAKTHLAHLLSLLRMHPNRLVFICVGKNARQLRSPTHCCSATSTGALPPAQLSTLVPRASSSPEGSDKASRSPWAKTPRKAMDIARYSPMGEYLCQVYRRNFSLCLGMIVPLVTPPLSQNYSQSSKD